MAQECGDHPAIAVTFPSGPQLLNATLFSGLDCSTDALSDNLNDQQSTMGSGIWMFTDDADVAGVSPSSTRGSSHDWLHQLHERDGHVPVATHSVRGSVTWTR